MKYLKVFDRHPDLQHEFGTYVKLTDDPAKLKNGAFNTGEEREYDQGASVQHPSRSRWSWTDAREGLMQVDRDRGGEGPVKRGWSALGYVKPGSDEWRARSLAHDGMRTDDIEANIAVYEPLQQFPVMSLLGPGYRGTRAGTSFYTPVDVEGNKTGGTRYASKLTKGELKEGQEGGWYKEHGDVEPDQAKLELLAALEAYYGYPSETALQLMKRDSRNWPDRALVLLDSDKPVTREDVKTGEWDPQRDVNEEAQLKHMKVLGEVPVWKYIQTKLPWKLQEYLNKVNGPGGQELKERAAEELRQAWKERGSDPRSLDDFLKYGPQEYTPGVVREMLKEDYRTRDALKGLTPEELDDLAARTEALITKKWKEMPDGRDRQDYDWESVVDDLEGVPGARAGWAYPGRNTMQYLSYLDDLDHDLREYLLDYMDVLNGEFNYDDPEVASDARVKYLKDPTDPRAVDGNRKKNLLAKHISTLRF